MSTKHTLGPWRFDPDNHNVYGGGLLAQVFGHLHNGEREANARLIAAAPDMLDELKAIHSNLHGDDGSCECSTLMIIEKAEGKTS